jgi:hypothetical protein
MRLRSQLAWLQFSLVTACKTHRFTGTSPLFEASHWPKWSSPLSEDCVTEQSWAITNQDILITNVNSNRKLDLDFWDLISISKFETNLQIESQTPYQKTIFLIHGHFDLKMSHFDSKNCLPDVLSWTVNRYTRASPETCDLWRTLEYPILSWILESGSERKKFLIND